MKMFPKTRERRAWEQKASAFHLSSQKKALRVVQDVWIQSANTQRWNGASLDEAIESNEVFDDMYEK